MSNSQKNSAVFDTPSNMRAGAGSDVRVFVRSSALYDELILQLVARRKELGWTQEMVNDDLGVADRLVSKWECGMKYPNFRHILMWTDILNCRLVIQDLD